MPTELANTYAQPAEARPRLGDVLVGLGILGADDLARALEAQRLAGGETRLGQTLRSLRMLSEADLVRALAALHQLPVVDLSLVTIDADVARTVPKALAQRHAVLVYGRTDDRLIVAVADPVDVVALDDIRAITGVTGLDVSVAAESQIRAALDHAWVEGEDDALVRDFIHEMVVDDEHEDVVNAVTDAATIRLVNRVLGHAARLGASDIHIEPRRDAVHVRLRIDGVLREIMTLPQQGYSALAARLKIIANLDVIERRLPQDGRARVRIEGARIDIRISTLPALNGEKVVIRLLPPANHLPSLRKLGLDVTHRVTLQDVARRPQGLMLITGPTGSGKTNTLYATIAEGVDSDRNVITLEDPVEIELPGITQVPIDEKIGMDFSRGLRAALRQDPDVLLVGEIRDRETAELTIRAALTGHLVLSTLHTLDAASAAARLIDMGVAPYLVTASLNLVVSQRLVRVPCPRCAEPETPDLSVLADLGITDASGSWLRAVGCPDCSHTGYRGRTAVVEMLDVGPEVKRALLERADEDTIRSVARAAGMITLLDHGISIARRGGTTLAEVLRAVPRESSGAR